MMPHMFHLFDAEIYNRLRQKRRKVNDDDVKKQAKAVSRKKRPPMKPLPLTLSLPFHGRVVRNFSAYFMVSPELLTLTCQSVEQILYCTSNKTTRLYLRKEKNHACG